MQITKVNLPSSKVSIKCPYSMTPQYITVHNTANDASAMSEVSYMQGNNNSVSFHYAVDDYRAVQGIELNRNTWNAGDGANGTGNRKSISIEICYSKSGGDRFVKAEKNAAKLVAQLLKKYGWGIDRVKKHQDWNGKYCPHRTLDMGWTRFINLIKAEMSGVKPSSTPSTPSSNTSQKELYKVKITANVLNVRMGPGTNYGIATTVHRGEVYTIVQESNGWGKLKSGAGWISLTYTTKVTSPTAASKPTTKKLYLPASATKWGIYKTNVQPVTKNIFAYLYPSKFGGLTYDILATPYPDVVTIQTRDYGRVNIYVAPSTGAVIK